MLSKFLRNTNINYTSSSFYSNKSVKTIYNHCHSINDLVIDDYKNNITNTKTSYIYCNYMGKYCKYMGKLLESPGLSPAAAWSLQHSAILAK